jgi:lipopolysaccharide heptosyltransferase II
VGQPDWTTATELLCVRLDTIGDVLMTGPALRALRESGARPRLTLMTSRSGAGAAALMPEVDEVVVYDAPWMKASAQRPDAQPDRAMVEELRRRRFDAAVIFTVYTQSPLPAALLCHLAEIPLRLAHCRENPYQLLTHHVAESEPHERTRHEVRRQLDLVGSVGARTADERLSVAVPEAKRAEVEGLLSRLGIDRERPWAVVHPGASAPSRRYREASWAKACRLLATEHDVQLVLTGDSSEAALVERVRREAGLPDRALAGVLNLGGLAALLEAAPLLLAGNTGPVHLAAAVGTPVVDLYALTNPQHTPWGVPSRVLSRDVPCRWCYKSICPEGHHRCLRGVPPGEVVEAALSLLGGTRPELVFRRHERVPRV